MTTLAVVTIVSGRHRHLARQHRSLDLGTRRPDLVVVVSMGDPGVHDVVAASPLRDVTVVLDLSADPGRLPLAHARNEGAAAAIDRGAELLVFLDVDCLGSAELLTRYEDAAGRVPGGHVFCGPVDYLPPLDSSADDYDEAQLRAAEPHPARPAPEPGVLERADVRLFWSLSFAVAAGTWTAIGGFDETYVGYGAEDTDFGQRARRSGASMWWVGGATAWHQWHPVSEPPTEHLDDIVRNANLFERRWGWFPMAGWLEAFAREGLAAREGSRWRVTAALDGAGLPPHA